MIGHRFVVRRGGDTVRQCGLCVRGVPSPATMRACELSCAVCHGPVYVSHVDGWGVLMCAACAGVRAADGAPPVRYGILRRREEPYGKEYACIAWDVVIAGPSKPLATYVVDPGPEGMADAMSRASLDRWRVLSQISVAQWLVWRTE